MTNIIDYNPVLCVPKYLAKTQQFFSLAIALVKECFVFASQFLSTPPYRVGVSLFAEIGEGRRQKAEGRRQNAEGRMQKIEDSKKNLLFSGSC